MVTERVIAEPRIDINAIRKGLQQLCDLWDAPSDPVAHFREEVDVARAVSIHTHAHHAARLGRAVLQLDDADASSEIVPLVRLILECGVTAAWLLLTEQSGYTLIRDGAVNRRRALTELAGMGKPVSPGYEQAVDLLKNYDEANVPKPYQMEKRCLALRSGPQLYVVYRVLSAESHAGLGIVDMYSVADDASPIGLSFNPDPERTTHASALGIAASMLLLALNADELARAKPRRTTQIAKIAKRLGVGTRIIRKDGYELPPRS